MLRKINIYSSDRIKDECVGGITQNTNYVGFHCPYRYYVSNVFMCIRNDSSVFIVFSVNSSQFQRDQKSMNQ